MPPLYDVVESSTITYIDASVEDYLYIIKNDTNKNIAFDNFIKMINLISVDVYYMYFTYIVSYDGSTTSLHKLVTKYAESFLHIFRNNKRKRFILKKTYLKLFGHEIKNNITNSVGTNISYMNRIRMYLYIIESSKHPMHKLNYFFLLIDYIIRHKKLLLTYRFENFKYTIQSKIIEAYVCVFTNDKHKLKIEDKYKKIFNVSINKELNKVIYKNGIISSYHRIFYDNLFLTPKQRYIICFAKTYECDETEANFYRPF